MDERLEKYEYKMEKTHENLLGEFGSIRAGRANPHVLDKLRVDYYGTPTPIQQVANVTVPEARMGRQYGKSHRESDPYFGSGAEPDQRREDDPSGVPRSDGGAEKRTG